jgi:plastocyanin
VRKRSVLVASVFVLALVLSACSGNSGGGTGYNYGGAPSATQSSSSGGTTGTTIVAQGFAFSPDTVSVSPGKVTLTVTNKDSTEHTFTLDDGSSSTNLPPGKTVTITLDLSKTVGWHCNIHPSMTGTLNVG